MSSETGAGRTDPRRRRVEQAPLVQEAVQAVSGRITALAEQRDPKRRSLFVDGEFVLGLDLETIVRLHLKVGQPVDGALLWQAYQLDQEKRAWDAGLRLLAAAPRTRREVERRLGRTYPPEAVECVAERLAAAGWLDDRAYAASYIRAHLDHGGRRLLSDLVRKGVERTVAAAALQAELGEVEVVEQARAVAASRLARMGQVDRVTAERRLIGFLVRRGFGPDSIRQALPPLLAPLPVPAVPQRGGTGLGRRSRLGQRRGLRDDDALPPDDDDA